MGNCCYVFSFPYTPGSVLYTCLALRCSTGFLCHPSCMHWHLHVIVRPNKMDLQTQILKMLIVFYNIHIVTEILTNKINNETKLTSSFSGTVAMLTWTSNVLPWLCIHLDNYLHLYLYHYCWYVTSARRW